MAKNDANDETARTETPTNDFGEAADRFLGYRDMVCDKCGRDDLDMWANEGVSYVCVVCPDCGTKGEI